MSNTPSKAEIEALAQQHLKAFVQFSLGEVWFEGEVEFARAVLARWGTPQPAPAPLSDDVAKDAARWRMAVLIGSEVMLHPNKRTHATAVKAYMDATHSGSDLTGAVDAALAAQGGKV